MDSFNESLKELSIAVYFCSHCLKGNLKINFTYYKNKSISLITNLKYMIIKNGMIPYIYLVNTAYTSYNRKQINPRLKKFIRFIYKHHLHSHIITYFTN